MKDPRAVKPERDSPILRGVKTLENINGNQ
jgi:hypothetical protein